MASIYRSAEAEARLKAAYGRILEHWPVPHEKVRVPTCEGETFVIVSGEPGAPPLVLLHGSLSNAAAWMGDVTALSRRFRVHVVDIIGEPGFSAPSRPPVTSDAYARWLDDVLTGLGLEQAGFVGLSLGGWMALDYAVRRPGRVSSLSLLCPGGIGRARAGFKWKALFLIMLGPWGKRMAIASIGRGRKTSPAAMAYMKLMVDTVRPRTETLPVLTDEQLRSLAMPVLLIVGGKDAILDSAESVRRLRAAVPGARIVELPDAGHVLVGQGPAILEFLS